MATETLRSKTCPIALNTYRLDPENLPIDFSSGFPVDGYVSPMQAGVLCVENCAGSTISEVAVDVRTNLVKALLNKCGITAPRLEEVCPMNPEAEGIPHAIGAVSGSMAGWTHTAIE